MFKRVKYAKFSLESVSMKLSPFPIVALELLEGYKMLQLASDVSVGSFSK